MMFRNTVFLCLLFPFLLPAQETPTPAISPIAIVSARYKDAYLKINYGQPSKRGRAIFGGLVPFGRVWRTGANEATEITFTRDITVNGTLTKAGTYSLFTIPDKTTWTIILNSEPGLWGAYNYNQKLDVMRFDVPVAVTDTVVQTFSIKIQQQYNKAQIVLMWDATMVSFPVQFIEPKP